MKKIVVVIAALFLSSAFGTQRDASQRAAFMRYNPCPATHKTKGACPGYVVDHIVALACGGADAPSNMQWQTVAEGKAKDKWERKGCKIKGPTA
jgi:hypothetical protein